MKYFRDFILIFAFVFCFSACTPPETKNKYKNEIVDNVSSLAPEDITVGFIYIGPINDGGYSQSHDIGRIKLENELGLKTIYKEMVPADNSAKKAIESMINQGANVIFSTSLEYADYVESLASKYKDIKFFQCGGTKTGSNLSVYSGKIYQARYLSGILAGNKTKSSKIGYVASIPVPEVIRGINAFTLGVKSVNKDAVVEVLWTDSWYDIEKEESLSQLLINAGVDVITMHQDTNLVSLVAERNGVNFISYNVNACNMDYKHCLASVYWDWGEYYIESINQILNKNSEDRYYWGDINSKVFDIALSDTEKNDLGMSDIDRAKNQLESSSLSVFKGPIYNNKAEIIVEKNNLLDDKEILEMNYFVEGVVGLRE